MFQFFHEKLTLCCFQKLYIFHENPKRKFEIFDSNKENNDLINIKVASKRNFNQKRFLENYALKINFKSIFISISAQFSFPYVLKRIPVKNRHSIELTPIEVAIDEMTSKVAEIEDVVLGPIDVKKLQLRLQGSVAVQVNAGPLAYASTFLDPKTCTKYSVEQVEELKDVFRHFTKICYTALQVNGRVISADQKEYHSALRDNYQKLCGTLGDLLGENLLTPDDDNSAHRNSLALFSAISGAPSSTSTA